MDFFDDLGKKIGETVRVVGDKSQNAVEMSKVNIEIGKLESTIKKLYSQIGEAVYKAHCGEEETADDIDNLCREISEYQVRIQGLKKRGQEIKGN